MSIAGTEPDARHDTSAGRKHFIKARDPVVFYRIGQEPTTGERSFGLGSRKPDRIAADYVVVDLSDALMRNENTARSTFSDLATDVAVKRLEDAGYAVGSRT